MFRGAKMSSQNVSSSNLTMEKHNSGKSASSIIQVGRLASMKKLDLGLNQNVTRPTKSKIKAILYLEQSLSLIGVSEEDEVDSSEDESSSPKKRLHYLDSLKSSNHMNANMSQLNPLKQSEEGKRDVGKKRKSLFSGNSSFLAPTPALHPSKKKTSLNASKLDNSVSSNSRDLYSDVSVLYNYDEKEEDGKHQQQSQVQN